MICCDSSARYRCLFSLYQRTFKRTKAKNDGGKSLAFSFGLQFVPLIPIIVPYSVKGGLLARRLTSRIPWKTFCPESFFVPQPNERKMGAKDRAHRYAVCTTEAKLVGWLGGICRPHSHLVNNNPTALEAAGKRAIPNMDRKLSHQVA